MILFPPVTHRFMETVISALQNNPDLTADKKKQIIWSYLNYFNDSTPPLRIRSHAGSSFVAPHYSLFGLVPHSPFAPVPVPFVPSTPSRPALPSPLALPALLAPLLRHWRSPWTSIGGPWELKLRSHGPPGGPWDLNLRSHGPRRR